MHIIFNAIEAEWKKIDEEQGCSFYRSNPDEPAQQQVQQQPQSQDHDQSGSFVSSGLGLLDTTRCLGASRDPLVARKGVG